MNEIEVKERVWRIADNKYKKKDSELIGGKFDKSKSVFRMFREETEDLRRKMFELDIGYSKIQRVIKNDEEEMGKVKDIMWNKYFKLKNIY